MINIISKQDRRYLTILETLYKKKTSTLKELSTLTKATRKTIQSDFTTMNSFIDPMTIETSTEGCTLVKPDDISTSFIYSKILAHSLEYSLLELIFFEKYSRLEEYADALFISLSTLKRMIKHINSRTEHYKFKITTGPIKLIGDELLICNTMVNFFSEKYPSLDYPFDKNQLIILDKILNYILEEQETYINIADLEKLKLFILTSLVRIKNGHYISIEKMIDLSQFDQTLFKDHLLKKSFKNIFHFELNQQNLTDLLYPFVNGDFIFNFQQLLEQTQENIQKNNLLNHIEQLINKLSEEFGIAIDQKEALLVDLYNSLVSTIGSNFLLYNKKKIFLDNLLADSSLKINLLYDYIHNFFKKIRPYEDYEVVQFVYLLVTHWKELAQKIQSVNPLYKVGVFMTEDTEHSSFITGMLNTHFQGKFEFQTIFSNDYLDAQLQFPHYDFIVTNLSNLFFQDTYFISIDLYPSEDDFTKIDNMYRYLCLITQQTKKYKL